MKYSCVILTLLTIFFFGCSKEEVSVSAVKQSETIDIKLDLEDHVYKLEDTWYSWADSFENCNPNFHAKYIIHSLTEGEINIRHCQDAGTIDVATLEILNDDCENPIESYSFESEGNIAKLTINIANDYNLCLLNNSQTVIVKFNFSN